MTNKLTGSYDAVAQISRRQLNGLLASLHQNGASEDRLEPRRLSRPIGRLMAALAKSWRES